MKYILFKNRMMFVASTFLFFCSASYVHAKKLESTYILSVANEQPALAQLKPLLRERHLQKDPHAPCKQEQSFWQSALNTTYYWAKDLLTQAPDESKLQQRLVGEANSYKAIREKYKQHGNYRPVSGLADFHALFVHHNNAITAFDILHRSQYTSCPDATTQFRTDANRRDGQALVATAVQQHKNQS